MRTRSRRTPTIPTNIFQDCGDFVVLAAFTTERRRVITFEDRQLVLVSFTGELFRLDTGVAVTYAGSARIEVGFDPRLGTVATTGLARYLIDLEGKRIVFDAGVFKAAISAATHQRFSSTALSGTKRRSAALLPDSAGAQFNGHHIAHGTPPTPVKSGTEDDDDRGESSESVPGT